MGRLFLAAGKTVLIVVMAVGSVIASFYFAYLLLILIFGGAIAAIAWHYFNKEPSLDWYRYEDSD